MPQEQEFLYILFPNITPELRTVPDTQQPFSKHLLGGIFQNEYSEHFKRIQVLQPEAAVLSLINMDVCIGKKKEKKSLTNDTLSYMGNYGRPALSP